MIADAIYKEKLGEVSPIFGLYELQWFVGLWNETQVQGISPSYKEELCIALLQACLLETKSRPECVSVCLEICEITSKVLDWRSSKQMTGTKVKPQHQQHAQGMAEFVTCRYLQFVELVAQNQVRTELHDSPFEAADGSSQASDRLQHLLFEIFKRILNYCKAQREQAQIDD